jgi:circadian clock protein KaiB
MALPKTVVVWPGSMVKRPTTKAALRLRLYIAGNAPNSLRAIANAKAICDQHFASGHEIEIVDLFLHPRRGLDDRILVTPTLLKLLPLPAQRLIGDLSDTNQVLRTLSAK